PHLPEHSAILTGHTHKKRLARKNGTVLVNPGSIALPKDGIRSYAVYEDGTFTLYNLEDNAVLGSISIDEAEEKADQ
ncbi:MAG: metallophosphoesterase family protein, partial [Eggerthellaceae bacterium]|nr:metallophosphoesterase family protein [Eggerthellaceae bacterium]